MKRRRIGALLRKESLELRRNLGLLLPVVLVAVLALALPFVVAIGIPAWTEERLSDDAELVRMSQAMDAAPDGICALELSDEGQVQAFLFQQFLVLFLLTPITGAMALAAHSIVGEKQARSLEPLLATPATTTELLVAKVIAALWPSLAVSLMSVAAYLSGIWIFALPGVGRAMFNIRTMLLVVVVGPAAALAALQAAILVSSRVNDARSAQQIGALLILPIAALLVAQFTGALRLSSAVLGAMGLGLVATWLLLVALSVRWFDRETILTRWR
jgi:ABC-2 type transport system permease protein